MLYDSFLQAQILSQEVRSSAARVFAYEDLMAALEDARILRRRDEALPTRDDMAERRRAGRGLVRPELAVLVAYAKRLLTDALLDSDLPDEAAFDHDAAHLLPAAGRRAVRAPARPSTRCGASWSRRSRPTTSSTRSGRRSCPG